MVELSGSMSRGRLAYLHDIRTSKKANIDTELSKDNVILVDELQGRTLEEYTNDTMQKYVDEYNATQKRADRKIKDYVSWHTAQKKMGPLAYEFVLQYGSHENFGSSYYNSHPEKRAELRRKYIRLFNRQLRAFQKDYPHLKVLWATIHFDEPNGTPHMHLAFQPIGEQYKQKLSHRVSVSKALELDGIKRIKSRSEAKESGFQLARMKAQFYEKHMLQFLQAQVSCHPNRYKIKDQEHRKHIDVDDMAVEFPKYQERKLRAQREADEALSTLKTAKNDLNSIQTQINTLETVKAQIETKIESLRRESEEKYNNLIDMIRDEKHMINVSSFVYMLKCDYPDVWEQIKGDIFYKMPYEPEDLEQEPSEELMALDDAVFHAEDVLEQTFDRDSLPDPEEIYSKPSSNDENDDYDDYER